MRRRLPESVVHYFPLRVDSAVNIIPHLVAPLLFLDLLNLTLFKSTEAFFFVRRDERREYVSAEVRAASGPGCVSRRIPTIFQRNVHQQGPNVVRVQWEKAERETL